jgi:hypothetical protein
MSFPLSFAADIIAASSERGKNMRERGEGIRSDRISATIVPIVIRRFGAEVPIEEMTRPVGGREISERLAVDGLGAPLDLAKLSNSLSISAARSTYRLRVK